MEESDFQRALAQFCLQRFGAAPLEPARRLSGGANMESWLFAVGGQEMVLRRMPEAMAERAAAQDAVTAVSLTGQAELIRIAGAQGVTAPQVLAELGPADALGQGFVMARAHGETLPHKILDNPAFAVAQARLTQQCARELAAIHALDPAMLPDEIQTVTARQLLDGQEAIYRQLGGAIAIFDHALGWLDRHCPDPVKPQLLHADFRMGNLMIDAEGISAVLDWELAHYGDPLEDLAYLCTPSWRFGHYDREAGGFDSADNMMAAYELASGTMVDRARFTWWLIYNTLWWGICCLRMGHSYRDGSAHTLERTIIGRRVSEVEIDLLLQFGAMRAAASPRLVWTLPPLAPTIGETGYSEMLGGLLGWNRSVIMPEAEGHALFQARMANNALSIVQRHAAWGQLFAELQQQRLTGLGFQNDALCAAMRAGDGDLNDIALWNHLRLTALERLAIDQPKYGGMRKALEEWT
jgi:aminoglycoside phosphotransferase (APT) family kinase protein